MGLPMSDFATARQKMVDGQVRTADVTDHRILDAMLALPREEFVPASKRALAYLDLDLDVAEGGSVPRCLIKPMLLGKLLQAAEIRAGDNVLIVGCASGYAAAVAARLAPKVSATERDESLAARARDALSRVGLPNVTIKVAEAPVGDSAGGPYDVILLNGATEIIPDTLCGQLRDGGRLLGVFAASQPPRATIVTRSHGDFGYRTLFDASAPVLPGLERVPVFVF
jgi:protein-L-isoaspartate(D-aspartate) O-methyltransferase